MNRIRSRMDQPTPPRPAEPVIHAAAFWLVRVPATPAVLTMQQLYLQAYEQAKAVCRPSLPERDLLACWN